MKLIMIWTLNKFGWLHISKKIQSCFDVLFVVKIFDFSFYSFFFFKNNMVNTSI